MAVVAEFVTELRNLIGAPPAGYEWLEYLAVAVILIFLLDSCVTLIAGIFKWIG